ncbi:MAG: PEGA domain-containing protein [Pseudomonadota bacterium]
MKRFLIMCVPALCLLPAGAWCLDAEDGREEFDAGIALYEKDDFKNALEKFKKFYELSSNWVVLYNIGQAHWMLGQHCEAMAAFKKYLLLGGKIIKAQQRDEVYGFLDELEEKASFIDLSVSPEGALVVMDGTRAGAAPFAEPVCVEPGIHELNISFEGYGVHTALVTTLEGKTIDVDVDLKKTGAGPEAGKDLEGVLKTGDAQKKKKKKKPLHKAWWLWTVVGVVVVGAAVGVALGVTKPIENSPDTSNDYSLP